MLIGGVIDDEIDDDADAARLAAMGELDEIARGAVARIDAVIVGDVVAVILAGRWLERHQPDRGDAEPVQVIQPPQQAFEVADAVTVGVHIGADGKTVEHGIFVPEVVDHPRQPLPLRLDVSGEVISGEGAVGSRAKQQLWLLILRSLRQQASRRTRPGSSTGAFMVRLAIRRHRPETALTRLLTMRDY